MEAWSLRILLLAAVVRAALARHLKVTDLVIRTKMLVGSEQAPLETCGVGELGPLRGPERRTRGQRTGLLAGHSGHFVLLVVAEAFRAGVGELGPFARLEL